ncbi:MAG: hypothetical protein PHE45_08885 [Bacteroidales bacterium]|jgi:hypothetical protein|nr:hypothetical protein [Bacteroidales bacterium]MDD3152985.1 hypothetical protein [Bacteroidales bacterium]
MAKIKFSNSILTRAITGEKSAISTMFQSFMGDDETIISVEYLGKYGVFFKTKSFVCITDKKVASLEYGPFGKIMYSDAFIEEINSGIIFQPSVLSLYIIGIILCCTVVGILLLNTWIKFYYKINKSGMVWCVREGVNIYAFANRSKIYLVNDLWRKASYLRGQRKQTIG